MIVLVLKLLGQIVRVADLDIIHQEHVSVVADPIEHLIKKQKQFF